MKTSVQKIAASRLPHIALCLCSLIGVVVIAPAVSSSLSDTGTTQPEWASQLKQQQSVKPSHVTTDKGVLAPLAPSITATLADSFTDADADNKAEPGQTVNYTVVISNGGPDPATGVAYNEPIDAITTLVPGSVHASPLAVNETYNWVGNTVLDTSARSLAAVTANDVAINPPGGTDTFTLTTLSNAATALGGTVTLAGNGHFVYTPPLGRPNAADGASVNDSFNYTLTNNADPSLTATGTVTLALTGRVWYVQNASVNGNGRDNSPFNTPASASTAADKSSDIIFIFTNTGNPAMNGGFALDNGQQLLGQGIPLVVNSITLYNSGTFPSFGNTAGNGVTLAAGASSTLSGFVITNCSGSAIASTAPNFGTLTVSMVSVNNTTGPALNLTSGTLAAAFSSLSSSGSATNAVSLTTCTGTLTSLAGGLGSATASVINISGGSVSMTHSGAVTQANNAAALAVSGGHSGTLTFQTGNFSATNGSGLQFDNADGTYNFNGPTTTLNGGDAGIDILNGSAGTFGFPASVSINNPSGIAYREDASSANVTFGGPITKNNNANNAIDINAKSGGTTSFNGAITASTSTANAIDLTNTGGTINFTNGLNVTTTSGVGFNATGGATVNATQNNTTILNTVTTTTGVGVNIVTPANIGASGVTFRSVSVNGAATGIVLNGTTGAFTVSGDGSQTSGLFDRDGSGGTIQNTTNDGVSLNNASNVTLRQMNLVGCGDTPSTGATDASTPSGEHTVQVVGGSNIILSAVLIQNPVCTGLLVNNVGGTNRVDNNSLFDTFPNGLTLHGIYVNNTSVNMTLFEIKNIRMTNFRSEASAVVFTNTGSANMMLSVKGSTFDDLDSQALTITSTGDTAVTPGTVTSVIGGPAAADRNTFRDAFAFTITGGIPVTAENNVGLLVSDNGKHITTLENNLFFNIAEEGQIANTSIIRTQNSGGEFTATIKNNEIRDINYASGAGGRHVIGHVYEPSISNANHFSNLTIDGNTANNITYVGNNREFIFVDYRASGTNPSSRGGNIKIINNNWNMPTAGAQQAIEMRFRQSISSTVNVLIDNNGNGVGVNGVTGATSNTAADFLDIDAEDAAIVNATITNNKFTDSDPANSEAISVATEDPAATGGPPTGCYNISGNNLSAAGNTIELNEQAADMNIPQASAAAVGTANGGATATVTAGSPDFSQPACTLPTAPEKSPELPDATTSSANVAEPHRPSEKTAIDDSVPANNGSHTVTNDRVVRSPIVGMFLSPPAFRSPAITASYTRPDKPKEAVTVAKHIAQQKGKDKSGPSSGEPVITTIGTLPANKSVTIKFQVTIPDPAGVTQISTRGTVSGTNFSNVLSTDPGPPVVNGATVTPIDLVDTNTTVVADDTSITAGDLVTFTATIARVSGSAGTITGTVQFKEDGNNIGSPVAVTGSGPFTAQLATRCLTVGSHTMTAVYTGDVNFKTSTGTLVGMQTVVKPAIVSVDDSFAGSGCTDLGSGLVLNRNAFQTIAGGQAGVATGGTVNVAEGTYVENVTVAMDTVSLSGNVQITGTLTLSGGTFNSTSGTLSITGNFNHTAGTFNHTGGTVTMNGSAAQTLGGSVQTTFNNLTINNATGVSLGVNKTGAGILNLTNGNLNAGAFTYELGAGGSSTRTSGHVLGNLKKTFSGAGAFTYQVGTANGYSPMTVTVTAGTGDLTVKAVQGPQPILNAAKSLQRYWTLAGSGLTVNMSFTYLDPTDLPAMPNEAVYRVIRVSGGSAFIYLDAPPTSFVDEAANTINVQNISGFSDWSAGEATAPTDAKLESFIATGYDNGTLIEWRTGFEVDNLGFNLYRDEAGKRVPVNSQMVAGSALVAGSGVTLRAGQSYRWWYNGIADCRLPIADCRTAQYWLESVDLNGQSAWHGPFFSKFIGGNVPVSANSSMLGRGESTQTGLTLPVERAAAPKVGVAGQNALQAGLAGQPAVKIWVKREGFYRVTASELAGAGLDPGTDTRFLQLYADGQQIPINVISDKDGRLIAIEFYGLGLDAAFTDQRVYWLVAGVQPGLRITQVKGSGQSTASQSFLYTAERRDRTIYFAGLRNGERENFFGPVIAASPVDQSLILQHVDQAATEAATIEVALQGVTTLPHKIWVYLNGTFVGESSFEGQAGAISKFNVAQSLLRSGDNQVRLIAQAGSSDTSLLDYIRISYWHSFTADDNVLRLTTPGNQEVTVGGFSTAAIRVLDVTDPDAPQELSAKIETQKTGFAVTAASPGQGERRLFAVADDRLIRPGKIAPNQTSGLRTPAHAADFVIIARREFFSAIEPLRALRIKQGMKVQLADIEDVFDEFSFGTKSPQAVKDFLQYAATSWKLRPRYVLLVGDASYDGKNYLGLGDSDLVPTRLIDTALMETASDDALADFNSDGIADLAVGRLPVRIPAEAAAIVEKIIDYQISEPLESMLLVADSNNEFDFESASAQLRALIPGTLNVEQINRGQEGDATAKRRLMDALTRGQKVVNYMGHGSVNLWSGNLLTNEDVVNLANRERLPVFVMMTCLNGYFHDPALDSLSESLLRAENGGAVAVWTSAGMTEPSDQSLLNKELYKLLFTSGNTLTLGEATARAKTAVTNIDIRRTWVLLGDPTMRLR